MSWLGSQEAKQDSPWVGWLYLTQANPPDPEAFRRDAIAVVPARRSSQGSRACPIGSVAIRRARSCLRKWGTFTYDGQNQLQQRVTQMHNNTNTTTYTYDPNGNQTGWQQTGTLPGTATFGYDTLNRLTSISVPYPQATGTYSYNGDGLRVGKTVGAGSTTYAWDPTGTPELLSDGAGNEYVWGQGLVATVSNGSAVYSLNNSLDSVRGGDDAGRRRERHERFRRRRALLRYQALDSAMTVQVFSVATHTEDDLALASALSAHAES